MGNDIRQWELLSATISALRGGCRTTTGEALIILLR